MYRPNVLSGRGQATTTKVRNITPDPNCGLASNQHGTAHMRDRLFGAGIAEIGWFRGLGDDGNEHSWVFYNVRSPDGLYDPPAVMSAFGAVDIWARFKIYVVNGTNNWIGCWERELNPPCAERTPPGGAFAGFSRGVPMGETTRLGSISAYDHHTNLWYQASTGTWYRWTSQVKEIDENDSYHWHRITGSEYEIHQPDAQH